MEEQKFYDKLEVLGRQVQDSIKTIDFNDKDYGGVIFMGTAREKEESPQGVIHMGIAGNDESLVNMLSEAFAKNERVRFIMSAAIARAISKRANQLGLTEGSETEKQDPIDELTSFLDSKPPFSTN